MAKYNNLSEDEIKRIKENKKSLEQANRLKGIERGLSGDGALLYDETTFEHLDDEVSTISKFIVVEMKKYDILSNLDVFIVEQLATTMNNIRICNEKINNEGVLVNGKENIAVKTLSKMHKQFNSLAMDLNFNPKARRSLSNKSYEEIQKATPLTLLMNRKNENRNNK